jgi:phage terminase large subunit-like protein
VSEDDRPVITGSDGEDFAAWCAENLIQSVDAWSGLPLALEDFQVEMMTEALAHDEDGWPIWRSVVICLPRKNGKTHLLAAYALYRLTKSKRFPEILLAASSDKQAGRLFDACALFIRRNPGYFSGPRRMRIRDHIGEIVREDGEGKILRMASDPGKLHGFNPSLVVCDELAQWTTPSLKRAYAALTTGGGARQAPQTFTITTAGEASERENSILGRMIDQATAKGEVEREPGLTISRHWAARLLLYNHEAPTADPHDIAAMKLANPASWISEEYLRKQAENPELTAGEVLQLHGCVWAAGVDSWLTPAEWQACLDADAVIPEQGNVYVGVDVGLKHDTTAVSWAWEREDGRIVVDSCVFAAQEEAVADDYSSVPDGVVRLESVEQFIRALSQRFCVMELAYDPRFFERSAQILSDEGLLVFPVHQNSAPMSDAYEAWYAGVVEGRLAHAGGRVLTAHVLATSAEKTDRGWRVRKTRQSRRIDACVASAMAFSRCSVAMTASWGVVF